MFRQLFRILSVAILCVASLALSPASPGAPSSHAPTPQPQIETAELADNISQFGEIEQTSAASGADFAGFAANPAGSGFWIVSKDGGVVTSGVDYFGGMNNTKLNGDIVGIAATQTGRGYWLVGSDGGIFSFGDASFYGSMGSASLNKPVIGMSATTTGRGYWLFAGDGGIFSFGDAQFRGSTGGMSLNSPIVGMSPTKNGAGYWLVGADGGMFSFDAPYFGSMGGTKLNSPVVGTLRSDSGAGYWQVAADGGIFSFGDAAFYGSGSAAARYTRFVGLATRANNAPGYVLVGSTGQKFEFGPGLNPISPTAGGACDAPGMPEPSAHSSYKFQSMRQDGTPYRFSACKTIRWQISTETVPPGAEELFRAAFDRTEAATGMDFEFVGYTSERMHDRVTNTENYRDGSSYKPILVGFQPGNGPDMCGNAGCARLAAVNGTIVSGAVVVNKDLPMAWGVTNGLGEIAIHEIAHVTGLGHVDDAGQVMYPYASKLTEYQGGDRRGLWLVGVGSPSLPPL